MLDEVFMRKWVTTAGGLSAEKASLSFAYRMRHLFT